MSVLKKLCQKHWDEEGGKDGIDARIIIDLARLSRSKRITKNWTGWEMLSLY